MTQSAFPGLATTSKCADICLTWSCRTVQADGSPGSYLLCSFCTSRSDEDAIARRNRGASALRVKRRHLCFHGDHCRICDAAGRQLHSLTSMTSYQIDTVVKILALYVRNRSSPSPTPKSEVEKDVACLVIASASRLQRVREWAGKALSTVAASFPSIYWNRRLIYCILDVLMSLSGGSASALETEEVGFLAFELCIEKAAERRKSLPGTRRSKVILGNARSPQPPGGTSVGLSQFCPEMAHRGLQVRTRTHVGHCAGEYLLSYDWATLITVFH